MKLEQQTILLISPEKWGTNKVSKHHYAEALAKAGNTVYFINPPDQELPVPVVVHPTQHRHLSVVDYKNKYRGLHKMPAALAARYIKKQLDIIANHLQCTPTVVWNFDPSRFFNLKRVSTKKILHIVDLNQQFNLKQACNTADVVLGVNQPICEMLAQYAPAHLIPHGYRAPLTLPHITIPGKAATIKVGYVGNLLMQYLDWPPLLRVVERHPHVDFIFIGPYETSNLAQGNAQEAHIAQLKQLPNAHLTGAVDAAMISGYLQQMHLLLLSYSSKEEHVKYVASTHKLLEYFASGVPIIANYTEAYKDRPDLLTMAPKGATIEALFEQHINKLDAFSQEDREARIAFAQHNTYEHQLQAIAALLA